MLTLFPTFAKRLACVVRKLACSTCSLAQHAIKTLGKPYKSEFLVRFGVRSVEAGLPAARAGGACLANTLNCTQNLDMGLACAVRKLAFLPRGAGAACLNQTLKA